eukprot:TRINITY_DN11774_c0_g1_i1.p1 TRINITY_DN11774_c0_g1~~TRINITY_DN11774_c0_g1_i1.p1  ORF type:complete len:572 (-),score=111.93 TRINITY_DN11774_c0_g1_i1:44-1681(-)
MENPNKVVALFQKVLTSTEEINQLAKAIIIYFISKNRHIDLLHWAVRSDLSRVESKHELFRKRTFAGTIIVEYTTLIAYEYMKDIMYQPIKTILHMLSKNKDLSFGPPSFQLVSEIVEVIMDAIVVTHDKQPMILRELIEYMYEKVEKKYENHGKEIIGSYLFSTLIIPAILNPSHFDIRLGTNNDTVYSRVTVIITKILHNIACASTFPESSRQDMTKYNVLIEESTEQMQNFVSASCEFVEKEYDLNYLYTKQKSELAFKCIHYYLYWYLEPMMEERSKKTTSSETRNFVRMLSILEENELTEGKPELVEFNIRDNAEKKKKSLFKFGRRVRSKRRKPKIVQPRRSHSSNTGRMASDAPPSLFNRKVNSVKARAEAEITEEEKNMKKYSEKLKSSLELRYILNNRQTAMKHRLILETYPCRDDSLIHQQHVELQKYNSMYMNTMLESVDIIETENESYSLDQRTALILETFTSSNTRKLLIDDKIGRSHSTRNRNGRKRRKRKDRDTIVGDGSSRRKRNRSTISGSLSTPAFIIDDVVAELSE